MSVNRYCCIQNCITKREQTGGTLFKIPDNFLKQWLPAIMAHLEIGILSNNCLYICDLHFREEDIEHDFVTKMPDGTMHKIPRDRPKLKNRCVPCFFTPESYANKTRKKVTDHSKKPKKVIKVCSNKSKKDITVSKLANFTPIVPRLCYLCKSDKSLHEAPKNPAQRSLWLQACGFEYETHIHNFRICAEHFKPKDYICIKTNRLKADAVPSIDIRQSQLILVTSASPSEKVNVLDVRNLNIPHEKLDHCYAKNDEKIVSTLLETTEDDQLLILQQTGNKENVENPEIITIPDDVTDIEEGVVEDYGRSDDECDELGHEVILMDSELEDNETRVLGNEEKTELAPYSHVKARSNPVYLRRRIRSQEIKIKMTQQKSQLLRKKILLLSTALGPYLEKIDTKNVPIPGIIQNLHTSSMYHKYLESSNLSELDKTIVISRLTGAVKLSLFKRYEHILKRWFSYCSEININCMKPEVSQLLDFFKRILEPTKFVYRSFTSHKIIILKIIDDNIASDPQVQLFFEEIAALYSPKREYTCTWDPHASLLTVSEWFPNEVLGLVELAKKTVLLLVLGTNVRMQALLRIKLDDVTETDIGIQINLPDYITSSICRPNSTTITLKFFKETPQLCIASALSQYIQRSSLLRPPIQELLFFDPKNSCSPITLNTLYNWLKRAMLDSGLDIKIFDNSSNSSPHKVEVFLDEIRKTAKWNDNMLIFTHFYDVLHK